MKRLSIMLILALLVSFAMSFTVGAVNINNSVLSSTSSISVSALGFYMDGTPRWGTRIGKLTLSNSNNTSFSGSNYFITLGGLNGGGGISYSLSGYFSDISTAFPSDISAIRSKALSSGYDIEYQFEPTVNTTQLKNVLNQANAKTNTGYTTTMWNAFVSAKSTAQTTLDNYTTKTQAQIDTAATNLHNAMDALSISPNLALLQTQLQQANNITDTGYTPETWRDFTIARAVAQNVINATTKTQTQIDNAYNNLNSAMDALKALPNISALQTLLAQAKAIQDAGYTTESWSQLQQLINSAETMIQNGNYSQAQVDLAYLTLQAAMQGLTLAPPPEPPPSETSNMESPKESIVHERPEISEYFDITQGFQPKHLIPAKEAILENLDVSRGYAIWVYFVAIFPLFGVFIFCAWVGVGPNSQATDDAEQINQMLEDHAASRSSSISAAFEKIQEDFESEFPDIATNPIITPPIDKPIPEVGGSNVPDINWEFPSDSSGIVSGDDTGSDGSDFEIPDWEYPGNP